MPPAQELAAFLTGLYFGVVLGMLLACAITFWLFEKVVLVGGRR